MREKLEQYIALTQIAADNEKQQAEIDTQINQLKTRKDELRKDQRKTDAHLEKIKSYMDRVKNIETRRMIELKYFSKLSWFQVAKRMGAGYSEDMVKKRVERYLKSNKK